MMHLYRITMACSLDYKGEPLDWSETAPILDKFGDHLTREFGGCTILTGSGKWRGQQRGVTESVCVFEVVTYDLPRERELMRNIVKKYATDLRQQSVLVTVQPVEVDWNWLDYSNANEEA